MCKCTELLFRLFLERDGRIVKKIVARILWPLMCQYKVYIAKELGKFSLDKLFEAGVFTRCALTF
jgi:hypothetical protein